MSDQPESDGTPRTPGERNRLAIAQFMIFLGGLGTFAGAVMVLIGLIRAVGGNEGGAMQAGGGIMILVVALPVLGVGLLLRPRSKTTPPSQPGV